MRVVPKPVKRATEAAPLLSGWEWISSDIQTSAACSAGLGSAE